MANKICPVMSGGPVGGGPNGTRNVELYPNWEALRIPDSTGTYRDESGDIISSEEYAAEVEINGKTFQYLSPNILYVECIKEYCQFWDETSEQCVYVRQDIKLLNVQNAIVSLESTVQDLNASIDEIKVDAEATKNSLVTIYNLDLHQHDAHMHGSAHSVSNTGNSTGGGTGGGTTIKGGSKITGVPMMLPPTVLMLEYMNMLDLDDNGLIYGHDFKIRADDPDKPMMLKTIEMAPDWIEPPADNNILYSEYLTYVEWDMDTTSGEE